jgi:oxygen-independent coproporphyrinogen-3 oxidase
MDQVKAMYVHIPFCKSICSYCDFTKVFYSFLYEEKYLKALFKEISESMVNKCNTIYIGGGTPSVLSNLGLEKLLAFLNKYLDNDYEFSIEVNPETINEDKVKLFAKYGINRVSIGVESFNEDILKILNRNHNYKDIENCVSLLNKYKISNYSFDFIYGINGLTLKHLENDFKQIDKLKPKHLSFYSLILEDNTCLKAKNYVELDDEIVVNQYDYIYKELLKRGYNQYEVSNYSLNGYKCKHNLVYWKDKEYYGFGLGASGYLNNIRYTNTKNLTKYLNFENTKIKEEVTLIDKKEEYIMLGLRLNEGISLSEYQKLFNEDLLVSKNKEIDSLLKQDLIKISDDRLFTTYQGMLLLDTVIIKLI